MLRLCSHTIYRTENSNFSICLGEVTQKGAQIFIRDHFFCYLGISHAQCSMSSFLLSWVYHLVYLALTDGQYARTFMETIVLAMLTRFFLSFPNLL